MTGTEKLAVVDASTDANEQEHPQKLGIARENERSRANARPEIFRSTAQEILFIFTATMSVAMPSFLQGSSLVVSSFIQKDLSMSTSQLTWMTASSS
jgi:hypothetical protein